VVNIKRRANYMRNNNKKKHNQDWNAKYTSGLHNTGC